jgi:catechol 2,3-dioxygenase-like lactoylglutathione lyase family enzyme
MTELRPSHVGVCVTDLDRSLRFWVDGLGFEAGERYELDTRLVPELHHALEVDGPVALVSQFVRLGAMAVELLAFSDPPPTGLPSATRRQLGLTHLAFHVADLGEAIAHVVRHGGTLVESTRVDVGTEVAFLEDPDGVRVELMQRPRPSI